MNTVYRGWIPTVSGALSFSAFGDVSHAPRTVSANRTDRQTRYLVCYRGRDCSDILVPFKSWVGPWFLNLNGKLWFLCIAKSQTTDGSQESIDGKVIVFHDRDIWRNNAQAVVADAQPLLRVYRYGVHPSLNAYFDPTYNRLLDELLPLSAFNADFHITRTGLAELRVPEPIVKHHSAPVLPTRSPNREHVRHILSAQLFFFLRDIGHRHQHHDPYTDTIVDLWEDTPADPFAWKLQTLFSLYRKVISYKRLRAPDSFSSSLGVRAYADTFRSIIEDGISDSDRNRLPKFYSENVAASISAVHGEIDRRHREVTHSRDVARELILASLALVISVVGVFQIVDQKLSVTPAPFLRFVAESLITQPLTTFGVVAGFLFCSRPRIFNPSSNRFIRWLLRVVQTFDLKFSIALFVLLTLISLGLLLTILFD